MKYGLVYFDETDNIGDDIQSYAIMQFLPQIDYLIDRERLNEFVSDAGEVTAVVLNGWYLHNKFNWPPAKSIYPLCTSIHFSVNDYMGIGYDFLNGISGEYLKNYGPIGCRDSSTLDILQQKGIPSFLSGCATLTLPQREKKHCEEYICLVDVPAGVPEYVAAKVAGSGVHIKQLTHKVDYLNEPLSWQERVEKVEDLLDIYQNAKCVVTKRLHCALPCLALKTPVLLLLDTDRDDVTRYSHFVDLLFVSSTKDLLNEKAEYDLLHPPVNKENYLIERKSLQGAIAAFICQTQNHQIRDGFQTWQQMSYSLIYRWRTNLLTRAAIYASGKVDCLLREKNRVEAETFERIKKIAGEYERDTNILKKSLDEQRAENKRLSSVISEKSTEEARLNNVIFLKDQEIVRNNKVITNLNNTITEYNNAASKQENTILSQKCTITDQNGTISNLNNTISSMNDTILNQNGIIVCLNDSVTDLKEQLKVREEKLKAYILKNEENSVSWLLFHSKTYKNAGIRNKLKLLKKALFGHKDDSKNYLEDIWE